MRRTITSLLTATATVLALLALVPTPASAAGSITGRLVDRTTQGTASLKVVPGAVVRLIPVLADGSPGTFESQTTTGSGGGFTLTPSSGTADYYLRVLPTTDYQGGWIALRDSDSTNNVESSLDPDSSIVDHRYTAGTGLGDVSTMPAYFSGRVINSKTLRPVANARITGRDANEGMTVEGTDLSGPKGYFRVNGLTCEDSCYLKVNGASIGYETGFLTGHRVVPTWGDAVAITPGPVGNVKLDRL